MASANTNIVIAEDNAVQRGYLAQLIKKLGYCPIAVENGQKAIEALEETNAQIVLTDLYMPVVDGLELTQRIRSLNLPYYVHVIMLTGAGEDDCRRGEALEIGVDDFLTKGSNTSLLRARLLTAKRLVQHASELAQKSETLRKFNEHIEEDLRAAAEAQRSLLPESDATFPGFKVASAFSPSAFVSGDMFGCFELNNSALGFYAVDVAGHGVHAALMSVAIGHLITPEYFNKMVVRKNDHYDLTALVHALNDRFFNPRTDGYFSMLCGVIDQQTESMTYCQAGYPSPFLIAPNTDVSEIGDGGLPVAMFKNIELEMGRIEFPAEAQLLIFSDGAIEAENEMGEQFGINRLKGLVSVAEDVSIESLPSKISKELQTWRSGQALEDDLTVIAIKRTSHDEP